MPAPTPTKSPENNKQIISSEISARIKECQKNNRIGCMQISAEQLISNKITLKKEYERKRCSLSKDLHKNTDRIEKINMLKPITKVKTRLWCMRGKIKIQSFIVCFVVFLLNISSINGSAPARQEGNIFYE